jgi:hypothetical protein
MLTQLQRTSEEVTQKTQELYDGEKTIITLFGNARQQVADYLKDVNPKTIDDAYNTACRATQEAINSCPKDGQKTDVKALTDKIISASSDSVRAFKSAFDGFYSAFDGKFTGDVSQETVELLCEQTFFNDFWKEVESLGLPAKFQQVSVELTKCESLAFDQLTPDQQSKLQDVIKSRLAELKTQIRAFDTSFIDRVKLLYIGPARESLRDLVKRIPGFKK